MPEKNPETWGLLTILINFSWMVIAIPLKLMWDRINFMQAQTKVEHGDIHSDLKEIKHGIDSQSAELNKHKLHVANNYLNKDDTKEIIEASIRPVKEGVDRIESLLNKNLKIHE